MDPITQQTILAAAGAGGDKVYVDDVFSADAYKGESSNRSIVNGIDLAGEGGLVWIKNRFAAGNHVMMDTDTGVTKYLSSNTYTFTNQTGAITSYNNNGFSLGTDSKVNGGNNDHIAWTFRKQPGFFDIVSWTGSGTSNRVLNHNLGSKPGMMLMQCTSTSQNWFVYHHSLGATKKLVLNEQYAEAGDGGDHLNNTEPTATQFTLGNSVYLNTSNRTYVAYLFADDDAQFGTSGNESIIKCGSYTGSGNSTDQEIDLGFEPQFLLIKYTGPAGQAPWMMVDQARGFQGYPGDNLDTYSIGANATNAETYTGGRVRLTARGFKFKSEGGSQYNDSGKNYVYMAIRRPHKPPETATEVFNAIAYLGNQSNPRAIAAGFAPDTVFGRRTQSSGTLWYDRIRGEDYYLNTYSNGASGQNTYYINQFLSNGYEVNSNWNSSATSNPYNHYVFRRAPGFYDVVAYSGTGSVANHIHNLGVVPELMIVKCLSAAENWRVYAAPLGATKALQINGTGGVSSTSSLYWNNTAPTSSVFTVPNYDGVNGSGKSYINFMFATLPGISKIGSYTGTGNAINVDCGFTNGARYIIIKRDGTGDWYQFSTTMGISNTTSPHYFFNLTAYVTGTNYINPLSTGFKVTSSAPAGLNASGGTYIFIAFA